MLKEKNKLDLVQTIRGMTCVLIVFYHVSVNMIDIFKRDFFANWFLFANGGVDIFFVLSGFVITYTTAKGSGNSKKILPFLQRRFVRIFPPYWIIIGLFLLAQLLLPSFYNTHYVFTLNNILPTFLLLPGHRMVNGVSWTLSYELFFYLLFSLAFLLPNKKVAFVFAMLYALFLIVIGMLGYNFENAGPWVTLLTNPMNVDFLMGVLAAALIPNISSRLSLPLIILGCVLFLLSAILGDNNYQLISGPFNRVLVFGMPSFLIIAGVVKFELSKKIVVHNIFVLLGEASYSTYLLHLPIIVAFMRVVARFNIHNIFVLDGFFLLMICGIFWGSILFFKCIERPVTNKLNAWHKQSTFLSPRTLSNDQK